MIVAFSEFIGVFSKSYTQSAELSYMRDNNTAYDFTTDELIPAIQMFSLFKNNLTGDILDYIHPFTLIVTSEIDAEGKKLVQASPMKAVLCKDLYPEDVYPNLAGQFVVVPD